MAIIYKCTNLINNKVYIGQTVYDLDWRLNNPWCGHCQNTGTYIGSAIHKYGKENFSFEVIEERSQSDFATKQEMLDWLNEREIYWIAKYQSNVDGKGYNLTSGGQYVRGKKHSEKTKEKLRLAARNRSPEAYKKTWATRRTFGGFHNKEKFRNNVSKAITEKWKDEEYRTKTSKAIKEGQNNPRTKAIWHEQRAGRPAWNKGKKATEEQRKRISLRTKEAMAALPEEVKRKMSEQKSLRFKGRIWINNGSINKFIKSEDFEMYDTNIWKRGKHKTEDK